MMSNDQLQSDQFQELLAEALRAGPGAPAWKQAVDTLRAAGKDSEEYAMLCRAREDLESGRDYRSIKAGPGFTHKLMGEIDRAEPSRWSFASANIITGLAISVVVILVTVALYFAFSPANADRSVTQLAEMFFTEAKLTTEFRNELPAEYGPIGSLPVKLDQGLRPEVPSDKSEQYVGGGVYLKTPIRAEQTVALETSIEFKEASTVTIAQLFVTDTPEFAQTTGLSAHELVCAVESGRVRAVLPDGTAAGEMPLVLGESSAANLRIRLSRTAAVVEHNNKIIWSGSHQLNEPRYVGIRFLTRGGESPAIAARHLRIMEP